jgi:hypothetical protein
MSFELALGLWAVVTLFAWPAAVFLIAILAPDIADGWRATVLRRVGPSAVCPLPSGSRTTSG